MNTWERAGSGRAFDGDTVAQGTNVRKMERQTEIGEILFREYFNTGYDPSCTSVGTTFAR